MSGSKKEKPLFDSHDRENHNIPSYETNEQQQGEFVDINGQLPYVNDYWVVQPQPNWNPSMEQTSNAQYPPAAYYQPYDYQTNQPVQPQYLSTSVLPPTSVSKTPFNKPSAALPVAPLGHTPHEPTGASSTLGIVHQPTITAPVQQPTITAPVQQPTILASVQQPTILGPVQQAVVPSVPFQHMQLPPRPFYYPHSPPSPYYYSRPPPSRYYHSRRSPPPYYYYDDRYSLPPIPRRERYRERDYYDRYHHDRDDPLIMSYFGRRRNNDSHRRGDRWYY